MKKVIKWVVIVCTVFTCGYFARKPVIVEKNNNPIVELSTELTECFADICPKYFSFDVDGDHLSESAVFVPTAMTRGAGKILIIKSGKVIFDSGEMAGAWIEQSEDGNGFYLLFTSDLETRKQEKVKYKFTNGQFVAI